MYIVVTNAFSDTILAQIQNCCIPHCKWPLPLLSLRCRDSAAALCRHNASVSCSGMNRNSASDVTLHRESLAQLWSLAAVALDLKEKTLYSYSNLDSGSEVDVIGAANAKEEWLAHALGGQLLRTVFSQCRRMGEVQTAATLICMMHTSEEMVDVLCTGDGDESSRFQHSCVVNNIMLCYMNILSRWEALPAALEVFIVYN